ncbi:MAG: hypothetical protein QF878_07680 [SAR202 cluster bacterium]|nr:hypothetical protein [SAR202 cluster bacterium]
MRRRCDLLALYVDCEPATPTDVRQVFPAIEGDCRDYAISLFLAPPAS